MDYDQDGRSDLVSWNEDHFEVHLQDERGLFASEPETFTTDVAFDSDDLSSLATGDMSGRVLHSLADLNGDGVADLVVFSLDGRSTSSKHSTYEVHFGARAPDGGTEFARGVGIAFQSDGKPIVFQHRQWVVRERPQVSTVTPTNSPDAWPHVQLGMDRHDFDGDGQVDLMFTTMGWVPLDLVLRGGTHESWKTNFDFLGCSNREPGLDQETNVTIRHQTSSQGCR
jgi:hypothetical protein